MKNKKIITAIIAIAVLSGLLWAAVISSPNSNSIREVKIEKMESKLGFGNVAFVYLPDGTRLMANENNVSQIMLSSQIAIQEIEGRYSILLLTGWIFEEDNGEWLPIEKDNSELITEKENRYKLEEVKIWENDNNDSVLFLPDGTNITFVASTGAKVITQKSGTIIVRNSDGSYVVKLSDGYLVKTPDGIWIVSPRETIETKKVSVYFP